MAASNDQDELASITRRENFMERRMRHARGEAADEPPDGPDDDPYEPEYDRQPAFIPVASGGGCAQAMLYAVLGALAMALIAVFAGNQLLSNFTSGVERQLSQVVATPTPTILDRGGTIRQIRNLNRLETQIFSVERIVEARQERGDWLDVFLGDRLLLIASGEVIAGVDLSKLETDDVTISEDGDSITINLPPSEILSVRLDNQRTRVYDRQTGLFADQNKDLETQARQTAEVEVLNAACENGIMQKAADEAERSLERLLKLMDFTSVTVVATPGACSASPQR